ncbi:MAG: Spy/CpxP family protein refolding chaperone [Thermoguttaceae bacterium]
MKKPFLYIFAAFVFAISLLIPPPASAQEYTPNKVDYFPEQNAQELPPEGIHENFDENGNSLGWTKYEYQYLDNGVLHIMATSVNEDGSPRISVPTPPTENEEIFDLLIARQMAIAESQGQMSWLRIDSDESDEIDDAFKYAGVTQEQIDAIKTALEQLDDVEIEQDDIDPTIENLSTEEAFTLVKETLGTLIDEMQIKYEEILTPEQLQRMREYELVAPSLVESIDSDLPFTLLPNFDAYRALDLSDEQLEQLEAIQNEAEAGFNSQFDNPKNLIKEYSEDHEEKARRIKAQNSEKMQNLRLKVRGILTPEQISRLEKLESEISVRLTTGSESAAADTNNATNSEPKEWQPNENSWKPGDPMPDEMKVEIKQPGRFPRAL